MTSTFTLAELAKEAAREAALRHRVYLRWVVEGKMKGDDADRKLAMMEAIAAKLAEEAEAEAEAGRLL